MNIVNRLTENDFKELCGVLCPYCRAKLPHCFGVDLKDAEVYRHVIPSTDHSFPCHASVLRRERTVAAYRMPAE